MTMGFSRCPEAASLDDAISEICKQYKDEEIILDSSDCVETNIVEFNL